MASTKKSGVNSKFFDVKVPITSAKVHLFGASAEEFVGKMIRLDLTRSLKGKSIELGLRVTLEGDELKGEPEYMEVSGSYIRRMIRKGIDYVEDSFEIDCRDFRVRVKPFLITRNKVSRAIRRELRNTARKFLEGYVKARSAK